MNQPEIVPESAVREQLQRVLTSQQFVHSVRLCRFLQSTVELTLEGAGGSLKEYTVGRDIFGRGDDYDPRKNSIVRVEAQRLRRKLKEYYQESGGRDKVLITYETGSYAPTFRWHPEAGQVPALAGFPQLDPHTVAVLPFANLSSDPEQELFCAGATEEIIHKLTTIPTLKVLGMSTVFALKGSTLGLGQACRRLGVGTLIDGSVQKSGQGLRITAKATEVATGRPLWSRHFDRKATDIFAIQDEIAQEVATALKVQFLVNRANPAQSPNLEAYKLYLQGRQTWDDTDPARCRAAIENFTRATALDPQYALPYTGLADAYQWLTLWGFMRPREAMPKCRQAALEALRLDPNSAQGYATLASVLCRFDWDWEGATAAANTALRLDPGCEPAHFWKATCALILGDFEGALKSSERAVELDPLSYRTNAALGNVYWCMGRFEPAKRWLISALDLQPNSDLTRFRLVLLYYCAGQYTRALEESSVVLHPRTDLFLGVHGAALARNGRQDKALRILRDLAETSAVRYVDPLAPALVQTGMEEYDAAFDSLSKAVEEKSPFLMYLKALPWFDPLRADPRFQTLAATIKLL